MPQEIKEEFCGACVAGIAALAGAGTAGGSRAIVSRDTRKLIFQIGVAVSVISIIALVYLLCKKCDKECS